MVKDTAKPEVRNGAFPGRAVFPAVSLRAGVEGLQWERTELGIVSFHGSPGRPWQGVGGKAAAQPL